MPKITLVDLASSIKHIFVSPFPPYDSRYKLTSIDVSVFEKSEKIVWGDKIVTDDPLIQTKWNSIAKTNHLLVDQYLKNPPAMVICQMPGTGKGVFAARAIKKREVLGIYPGELSHRNGLEIFRYSNESKSNYVMSMSANGYELESKENELRLFFIDSFKIRNIMSYFQHLPKNEKIASGEVMKFTSLSYLPEKIAFENVEFETIIHNGCPLRLARASRDIEEKEIIGFSYDEDLSSTANFRFFTKFGEDLIFYDLRPALHALADKDKKLSEDEKFTYILTGLSITHQSLLKKLTFEDVQMIKNAIIKLPSYYLERYKDENIKNNCALKNLHLLSENVYDKADFELALRQAAAKDDLFMVLCFIHRGIDIDAVGKKTKDNIVPSGKTALHFCLERENFGIARILIFFGANLIIKDAQNITPMDLINKNKSIPEDLLAVVKLKNPNAIEDKDKSTISNRV